MTDTEVLLWARIRKKQIKGIQFLRQRPIGNYIVDFYAPDVQLVIEVDGGQHFSEEGRDYDRQRDAYLKGLGLRILRFTNSEVFQHMDDIVSIHFYFDQRISIVFFDSFESRILDSEFFTDDHILIPGMIHSIQVEPVRGYPGF